MSAHTAGPWQLWTSCSWRRFCTPDGRPVCVPEVARHDGHPDLLVSEADAKLIVAAPDLLTAAIEAMSAMDSIWRTKGKDDDWIYDEMGSELSAGYFSLRAAIAKATA